jgi:hypothetical protein
MPGNRSNVASERGKVGGLIVTGASAERIEEARRELHFAVSTAYIRKIVEGTPPLTPVQRAQLAALLTGGGDAA